MKEIVIYKKEICPYCQAAFKLFRENDIPYTPIEVTQLPLEKWNEVKNKSGMTTVPQIFMGDILIGGFSELASKVNRLGIDWLKSATGEE